MNSKFLLLVMVLFALVSCNQNPQKKAKKNAEQHERAAEIEANRAERDAENSIIETGIAIENAILAGANEAMAKIIVPKFKSMTSNELVKKIGNDVINYVNANDSRNAAHYQKLLSKHIERVKKKVGNESISMEDAKQIKNYAQNLASSVGLTINID